jgi:hypothetical protein
VLGAAAAGLSFGFVSSKRLLTIPSATFDRFVAAGVVISRFGLFLLIFAVLKIKPKGDEGFYFEEAQKFLQHLIPYRDFRSSYAPLHAVMDAAFLHLWNNTLILMFFAVACEAALIFLWLRFGRSLFAESHVRIAALLYLASPISLQYTVVDGQDNVIIALLMVLSLYYLFKRKDLLSGVLFAASVCCVKFLPLLFAPELFFASSRRWRWALAAVIPTALIYGWFQFVLHANITVPVSHEGAIRTAGNLPYLVSTIIGIDLPLGVLDLIFLLLVLATIVVCLRALWHQDLATRSRLAVFAVAAVNLAFVLFSKKSWPSYLMLSLFPVSLVPSFDPADPKRQKSWSWLLAGFCFFGFVAVVENSVWFSLFLKAPAPAMHTMILQGNKVAIMFLLMQLVLIGGYLLLFVEAIRRTLRPYETLPDHAAAPPNATAPGDQALAR